MLGKRPVRFGPAGLPKKCLKNIPYLVTLRPTRAANTGQNNLIAWRTGTAPNLREAELLTAEHSKKEMKP